jgi:hypothetical protein
VSVEDRERFAAQRVVRPLDRGESSLTEQGNEGSQLLVAGAGCVGVAIGALNATGK